MTSYPSQVLRPATREKLRIEGEMYQKVLSEYLQILPLYLGGKCSCDRCRHVGDWNSDSHHMYRSKTRSDDTDGGSTTEDATGALHSSFQSDIDSNDSFNQVVRTSVIAMLMLWLFFVLLAGLWDPETRPFSSHHYY